MSHSQDYKNPEVDHYSVPANIFRWGLWDHSAGTYSNCNRQTDNKEGAAHFLLYMLWNKIISSFFPIDEEAR